MGIATLINEDSNEQEEVNNFEQDDVTEEVATEPEDDLPEKYRGKSMKEIVQMHQEAEKLLGRHSSEVGELRKVVDDYIRANLAEKTAPQQNEPEDDIDIFTDPEKAVTKYIESNPQVQQATQYARQAQMAMAVQNVKAKHPDMEQIVNDNRFIDWVKASKFRTQLLVQADQYDAEAADELLSNWKALNKQAQEVATADQQARKQEVRKASTGAARGSVEQRGKKKYRRRDIIELIKNDPNRYEALSPDIALAFREGRVIS